MIQRPDIDFEAETHTYWIAGRKLLSVTQQLEEAGVSDFSMVPPDQLWWAQVRGDMVHRAAPMVYDGTLDDSSVDERIGGYVEALRKFCRDHEFTCFQSELLLYRRITLTGADAVAQSPTDLEIIGRCDAIGKMRHSGLVIPDLKTGEPSDSWAPQLAGYTRAYDRGAQYTYKRVNIQLMRDGNYKLHWWKIRDFDQHFEVLRQAMIANKRRELEAA